MRLSTFVTHHLKRSGNAAARALGFSWSTFFRWMTSREPSLRDALLLHVKTGGAVGLLDMLHGDVPPELEELRQRLAGHALLTGLPAPEGGERDSA